MEKKRKRGEKRRKRRNDRYLTMIQYKRGCNINPNQPHCKIVLRNLIFCQQVGATYDLYRLCI